MANVKASTLLQTSSGIRNKDACVVIVRTEWNAEIVDALEAGALRELKKAGIRHIRVITIPGAVEIPFTIRFDWQHPDKLKPADAYIALGCVVRGGTPHFEYVCRTVTDGVLQLNLQLPVPVIFGVLTVDNPQQARERVGGKEGHKGEEAALTALQMIALMESRTARKKRKK